MLTLVLALALPAQALQPLRYVDPLGRRPTTYQDYMATRTDAPFRAEVSAPTGGGYDRLVVVFVNSTLKQELGAVLDTWYLDMAADGYAVREIACLGGSARNLRQMLIALRDSGLVGTVMVGDLPVAWWEDSNYGEDYPIDLFFQDLNGTFADNDGDGMWDGHSGSTAPEIWCGRIHATRLTYGSEVRLIRDYFQRNHLYRNGRLSVPRRGLVYNEVTWYPNSHGMSNLYTDITMFNDENATTAAHYKWQLRLGFEFVHIIAHSSPWVHSFFLAGDEFGAGSLFGFEVPALSPNAAFYFVNGCMCGRYTEKDNLCNWGLFAGPWSQALIASSQLMYGVSDVSSLYTALARDSSFGPAFMTWYRSNYTSFRGTLILGDPTQKLDRTEQQAARVVPAVQEPSPPVDWTEYAIDTTNFVNGRPGIACSQGRIRIIFDSGRIVRSDNYYSFFDGTRFTRPESLAWHEYYDLHPASCADATGRWWVTWQSFRDYGSYDHFQLFSSYWYNGSWSAIQRVGPAAGYHDVEPALASGTNNVVWCAFKSWRNGQGDIWVSSATNGGAWATPARLTTDSLDQLDPCVAVDAENHPWVFWTSLTNGRWQLHCRTYQAGWLPVVVLDTLGDNSTPRAACDAGGRVWLLWSKYLGGRTDIWYSCLEDSVWTAPAPLTATDCDDLLPDVAATPDGTVWACWQSKQNGPWDVFASRYEDNWTTPQPVTNDAANDYDPGIAADTSGNVWVAWASDRRGYWNVYAAMSPQTRLTGRPQMRPQAVRAFPNPFRGAVTFSGPAGFKADVFGPDGRLVSHLSAPTGTATWAPQNLPSGLYLLRKGDTLLKLLKVR
jgi:hypothetical protein